MNKKLSCQDIVELVTDYIEDALPGEEFSRSRRDTTGDRARRPPRAGRRGTTVQDLARRAQVPVPPLYLADQIAGV